MQQNAVNFEACANRVFLRGSCLLCFFLIPVLAKGAHIMTA